MYLAYYGLKKEAFHSTPDPSFLFLSSSHKEALGAIVYGVEKKKGFIEIVGEVGVGKTTIIRAFLEEHCDPKHKSIYILNPVVSYEALLTAILKALDLAPAHNDVAEMVSQLQEALVEVYKDGGTVILIIDEAQNMPIETLENLRMLSNLETATEKLMQVVLVGQPELESLLRRPELRQFQQRIALRAKIHALNEKESIAFIRHRIAVASTPRNPVFTDSALRLIARKGQGIPRRLIVLCDNALITGFGKQITPVPMSIVKETLSDVDGDLPRVMWKWAFALGCVLLLGLSLLVFWKPFNASLSNTEFETREQGYSSRVENNDVVDRDRLKPEHVSTETIQYADIPEVSKSGNVESNTFRETQKDENHSRPIVSQASENQVEDPEQLVIQPQTFQPTNRQPQIQNFSMPKGQSDYGSESNKKNMQAQSSNTLRTNPNSSLMTRPAPQTPLTKTLAMIRAVKNGESLSEITRDTYGSTEKKYIEWVKRHNPQIANPDMILPGQQLVLPEYPKDNELQ